MDRTEMRMQNHEATLKSLETQVGQFEKLMNTRPTRGLPNDTEVAKRSTHEQCKAFTTRSGKQLKEIGTKEPKEKQPRDPVALADADATTSVEPGSSVSTSKPTDTPDIINEKADKLEHLTLPQIRFRCKKGIENIRPPPHFHSG
ncbi:hypothetical protein HRI_004734500 [Hibiscus trionum]|uniref:Uncharacterized protein n=1 Tax=Hibiscus trionum TaxID=183268 RepID=A0A9W7J9N4_HIBTR|nr:hypothetical protein HRI_004734500 [Hibiscus trionum]